MARSRGRERVAMLLRIIDEAFDRKAWHGTTLRGSIRGITAEKARLRPAKGRHNIAELVIHAAYWKYSVRRRITGEKRGSFAYEGSNWFDADGAFGPKEWKEAIAVLQREHDELKAAVAALSDADLDRNSGGKRVWTYGQLVSGIAAHDLYHTGQIQLVKRLVLE